MDIFEEMEENFPSTHNPLITLTKDEINELPLYAYSGNITLVTNEEEEDRALDKLNGVAVVGFDTETKPSFRKGTSYNPSLIQIATPSEVILFHLKTLPLSPKLAEVFEAPSIIKAGVAISEDMRTLTRLNSFKPQGLVDLGNAAKHHNIGNQGLRSLAALLLGIRISKNEQCSNWGKQILTQKQIRYAATDAWISLALYFRMQELNLSIEDRPLQKQQSKSRKKTAPVKKGGNSKHHTVPGHKPALPSFS